MCGDQRRRHRTPEKIARYPRHRHRPQPSHAGGRRQTRARGFEIESIIKDVHALPFPDDSVDVVTLQWASRHLRVVDVFSEIRRVLKPGGCFYHCDMLRPERKLVGILYGAYLKACVSATALAFHSSNDAWFCRHYFVRAIAMFHSSRELTELLLRVGFTDVIDQTAVGGTGRQTIAARAVDPPEPAGLTGP